MSRFTRAMAIVVSVLAGCSSAAPRVTSIPTQGPAASLPATSGPGPTPITSAQVGARELPDGALERGTYFGEFDGIRFTFEVPDAGWVGYAEHACCVILKGGDAEGATIFFSGDITELYARACDSSGTEIEFGPTVDDLAEAMASLKDFEVTGPTDVTLSGYHGKRVALKVPLGIDVHDPDCFGGSYWLTPTRYYQAPGQIDDNWILDIAGKRMVPTFSTTPKTPADVLEQVERIRDSLTIERL